MPHLDDRLVLNACHHSHNGDIQEEGGRRSGLQIRKGRSSMVISLASRREACGEVEVEALHNQRPTHHHRPYLPSHHHLKEIGQRRGLIGHHPWRYNQPPQCHLQNSKRKRQKLAGEIGSKWWSAIGHLQVLECGMPVFQ